MFGAVCYTALGSWNTAQCCTACKQYSWYFRSKFSDSYFSILSTIPDVAFLYRVFVSFHLFYVRISTAVVGQLWQHTGTTREAFKILMSGSPSQRCYLVWCAV